MRIPKCAKFVLDLVEVNVFNLLSTDIREAKGEKERASEQAALYPVQSPRPAMDGSCQESKTQSSFPHECQES